MTAWTLGMAPTVCASNAALPVLDAKDAAVSIVTNGNVMNINSTAASNLIKWVDFSIASGKTVDFHDKNYLNYVTGHAVSDIYGTLKGTGDVYFVNPNGILLHDGATVNVGNLHLSTKELSAVNLTDYTTATGALSSASIGTGDVINMGTLNATNISVEGNNITFKNVADVKNFAGDAINTNVTLTAKSGGEIHIGSEAGGESGYITRGTTYNYKLVSDANGLQAINNTSGNSTGNYMLKNDIDMSETANFTPIASGESGNWRFTGRFDGLGYQIKDITINNSDTANVGLFGRNSGVIENVGLAGGSVKGTRSDVCRVGGIVGGNTGTVRNVWNTATVTGTSTDDYGQACVGGIVGLNEGGTVERAYNTGAVTGANNNGTGGIVGRMTTGTVSQVFNTGTVLNESQGNAGGIVGQIVNYGTLENAYNTGNVTAVKFVGGVVGANKGTVKNVYNQGAVTATGTDWPVAAGIICANNGTLTNGYSKSGVASGDPANDTVGPGGSGGEAIAAENLMKQTSYTGFDFSENGIWRIYEGQTTPLLTAFMTRKDYNKETTVYNGTETGDVGTHYTATTYNGAEAQLGGVNYISDVSIVKPKDLTVSFAAISKTYDGTTGATAGEATLTGKVETDDVSLAAGVTANYEDKNAGTNKQVNYTNVALTGDAAKNYNLTNAATVTGTGTITPKDISATFADVSKVYDGTTDATAGTATLTGVITGDTVNVSGTAAFADRNAGTNKTVNYTDVTLSGTDAANYTIADTATGTGTIDKANLTITSDPVTKTYDGTTDAMGVANIASGTLYDGDIISGGDFAFTDKNAGTNKTVTVSDVTIHDGNNGGNYNVTYEANTASTINRRDAQVTFNPITKTYDGTTSATPGTAEFWGLINADKGKVGVTADAAYEDKNVGTGKKVKYTNVTLTGTEAQNYYLTQTDFNVLTGTITRKALELVATPQTIAEGEATPTAWNGSVTGFVTGEELDANDTLSFALDNPAAAAVGSYKVTGTLSIGGAAPLASGNYGANYTFANAAANDTAFTIAAKSMTPQEIVADHIAVSGAAQEYTGTITALESTARDENQTAPPQEKLAAGTTATHTSHLTIENGGVNTPPNMDVAAALAAEASAEQTAATQESEEEEA